MTYDNPDEIIEELFNSLLSKYQIALETQMRGSDFVFDCVKMLYCQCHKINVKRGGSYINSPDWIKKKKAKINPKNDDDKCFQYAAKIALNFEEIKKDLQSVLNIKPFINNYNWEGIICPSKIEDWKKFEKNNWTIALNVLYIRKHIFVYLYKEICPAYISKINPSFEKQIILSMIPYEEKKGWYYLAVKKLSTLFRGIT